MIVHDDVLHTVCFVCVRRNDQWRFAGTAFFFGIELGKTGKSAVHVVTAWHVIANAQDRTKTDDGCAYLRVNVNGGGVEYVRIDPSAWVRWDPADETIDLAVSFWSHTLDEYDFKFAAPSQCATAEVISREQVRPGLQVFLPGLFGSHGGEERNVPVVRVGNIASMPPDRVRTKKLGRIDAYLVETRSVGGLSGSPVFVDLGHFRQEDDGTHVRRPADSLTTYLLGIMHGHLDVPVELPAGDQTVVSAEYVNMGIAIVTPVVKLLRMFVELPQLRERNRWHQGLLEAQGIGPEVAEPSPSPPASTDPEG